MMFKIKISRKHISIVFTLGNLWLFNFYWEPKLFSESIHYAYPNKMGLWLVIFDCWILDFLIFN